jgi:hypothetical protein
MIGNTRYQIVFVFFFSILVASFVIQLEMFCSLIFPLKSWIAFAESVI